MPKLPKILYNITPKEKARDFFLVVYFLKLGDLQQGFIISEDILMLLYEDIQ